MNQNYCPDVSAVLVTYNPDRQVLSATLRAVWNQVAKVIIVDNASSDFPLDVLGMHEGRCSAELHLVRLEKNLGIAAGLNVGIRQSIARGAEFVLLLDQDSQAAPDMVARLRCAYDALRRKNVRVAALGPRYCDPDGGALSGFVRVGRACFICRERDRNGETVEADFLLSSGSLLPVEVLCQTGLMDEGLFIDRVDMEWCFRAKFLGFRIFGVGDAFMTHALGDRRKVIRFFRNRTVPFHKPFRYYYIFRNSLLLYRCGYMPLGWKIANAVLCLKTAVFFGLAGENPLACLKMMGLGILDGLRGVSGKNDRF